MAFALSTAHAIGLALVGAAFITFALISSFVLAGRNPNFPGRRRNAYLALCGAFFLAMMAAVVVFGRESKSEAAAPGTSTSTTTTPSKGAGNAAAGKAAFNSVGCSSCHTFKPAGSTGQVGPDLDNLKEAATKAGKPLDQFISMSITDP